MGEPRDPIRTEAFAREIVVRVSDEVDECGQFAVSLLVDGKERWTGHFTDKSEEPRWS